MTSDPLHIIVSRMSDATYLKVSRECDRVYMAGLLAEALAMVTASETPTVKPEDCRLDVVITLGDRQE